MASGYAGYQSPTSFGGASPMGAGYMSQEQSPSNSGAEQPRSMHILTPCSIRQLYNAKQSSADDVFHLDGVPLNQVTIVGQVMYMTKTDSNISVEINDGSGSINARLWEPEEPQEENWREGSYVRLVGRLKCFSEQRSLLVSKVRLIDDMNEITYHLAEVIKVHLFNTQGPPGSSEYQYDTQTAYSTSAYSGGYSAAASSSSTAGGGEDLNAMVLKVIAAHNHEPMGVSKETILEEMAKKGYPMSYETLSNAISALETDGSVYGGALDDTYKAV
uniref:Replication protein A C-terminal domain-containing protein n=1 Tax=Paramoeba aestuarina TaxID=180227 RepID=A0A7S4NN61_9EUKA|eukprot:CAMPEP_0201525028 /NCGR_PEP_ID=MMETSP0161_2-20130828/26422_1 /ASSEMBLY_ACC=CAM_ASM_000251 /TAXON_ID=180227 /ORGANISM="Neoparamoeba aestuarina, Strain SoJaBio B1-5/56/2" /LENGTH=273 /DNA_ID=CAMNT_0047924747 /DNA_START=49 /DNA_END=870 /DNA_ORIENTATION=+